MNTRITGRERAQASLQALASEVLASSPAPALQLLAARLDRRRFLQLTGVAGGGLMLGFSLRPAGAGDATDARVPDADTLAPSAYLRISPDGILIHATQPECGQGVKTSMPMIIAEELDAAWSDVEVRQSWISEADFGRQFAGGSTGIPRVWEPMRRAGAVARAMLVAAAAERWGVPAGECVTEASHVLHSASGRRAAYLELAEAAARLPVPDPATLALKDRAAFRLLGTRVTGVDNAALVRGEPLFGSDQQLPGMLYAAYVKCPAIGGRVRSANLEDILALPGIESAFILEGNDNLTELKPGVAIVGRDTWAVLKAREALEVEWDESSAARDDWADTARQAMALAGGPGAERLADQGDVEAAFTRAAQTVESVYRYGFVSHAQLEPQTCTAWYHADEDHLELWAPTQTPQRAVSNVAGLLGMDESAITLHQLRMGGGFGRRLVNDPVCEAAAIARRMNRPVKLQWTREDDMQNDYLRAGGFHALKGAVDAQGRAVAWQNHFVTFTADGRSPVMGGNLRPEEDFGHLIANFRLERTQLPWTSPCGFWRAPGASVFGFALQSFLHELSTAAGRDHLEFLLEILGEPRWLEPGNTWAMHTGRAADVLKLAAEKAGWGRSLPEGRALGLAFFCSHAAHVAEVAEVSIDDRRRIRVHEITVACDVGPIVNLSGAENQSEGSVIDGLSAMAGQQLTHVRGRVRETNFDRYPLLRLPQAPRVTTHFIQSDWAPTGLGEPVLPPVAPAVCNAVFTASGHRIRSMPISEEGFTFV
jgi:isoquinoline 1-oxidoreductase subunit beta